MFRFLSIASWKSQKEFCRVSQAASKLLTNFRGVHGSEPYCDEDYDEEPRSRSNSRYYRPRNSRFDRDDSGFNRNYQNRDRHFPQKQNFAFGRKGGMNNYNSFFADESLNSSPDSEKWQTEIEKCFYIEHPDVQQRSEEEVQSYRESLSITVRGSDVPKPITNFGELCLPESLKKLVLEQGYSDPTPIQAQGWPTALSGRDMVGISQTGSGKTLVFALPAIIHAMNQPDVNMRRNQSKPQVLVLGPTRELVQQILQVTDKFSQSCKLHSACAYGGASKVNQLRSLAGAHICVATPGRLLDFLSEGSVNLEECSYLVLDEADRMLDMGFEPQIRSIVKQIRPDRQTLMWSATWPKEIQRLAEDFLSNYVQVTVGAGELVANPNIKQCIHMVDEYGKKKQFLDLLERIINKEGAKVLVFAQTKRKVDDISYYLGDINIPSAHIHGDVSQHRRDQALHFFRSQKSCVLIATDVAARGLDITDVQYVINFDLPTNIEDYIHRIGRTARGTATGVAHSFFTPDDAGLAGDLVAVMKQANQEIHPDLIPMAGRRMFKNKKNFNYGPRGGFQRRQYF